MRIPNPRRFYSTYFPSSAFCSTVSFTPASGYTTSFGLLIRHPRRAPAPRRPIGTIVIAGIIFGDINIVGIVTNFIKLSVTSGAAYKLHTIKSKWQQQVQPMQQQPVAGQVVSGQMEAKHFLPKL